MSTPNPPPSTPPSGQGEHTPVPWYIRHSTVSAGKRKGHITFIDVFPRSEENVSGTPIFTANKNRPEAEENARFIVEAVNAHASLLARNAALEQALRKCRGIILLAKVAEAYQHTDDDRAVSRFAKGHADIKAIDALLTPSTLTA